MTHIPHFPFGYSHYSGEAAAYDAAPMSMEHLERGADMSMYRYSQAATAEHELHERRKSYQERAEFAGPIRASAYTAMAGICRILADRRGRQASDSFADAEHYMDEIHKRQSDGLQ